MSQAYFYLNDKHRDGGVLGNYDWSDDAGFNEDHVIALGAHAAKPVGLEDFDQLLIRNGAKLWHASVEAGVLRAAH